ncbi:hypothetical protein KC19_9G084000 [Ceratodon purpureus]|uniref:Secreted protein n=1 Tax=Ceratodon purpureus TaxID=3225 RepID=A0A8T0GSY8_CERPU|nr:hypothetical protein KC19_9G084000 [Ceratodon purpureus]
MRKLPTPFSTFSSSSPWLVIAHVIWLIDATWSSCAETQSTLKSVITSTNAKNSSFELCRGV